MAHVYWQHETSEQIPSKSRDDIGFHKYREEQGNYSIDVTASSKFYHPILNPCLPNSKINKTRFRTEISHDNGNSKPSFGKFQVIESSEVCWEKTSEVGAVQIDSRDSTERA